VRRHRGLHELLAAAAYPLAADVALHGEHARRVVQLLGDVFTDALKRLATTTLRLFWFVADLHPGQLRRQWLAPRGCRLRLRAGCLSQLLELLLDCGDVFGHRL